MIFEGRYTYGYGAIYINTIGLLAKDVSPIAVNLPYPSVRDVVPALSVAGFNSLTGFSNYIPGAGYGFGLGFAVRRDTGVADSNGSPGDYNWGGAFGTYFWVDPKEQLVVVSMTQAPGPIRVHYRHLFKALVYQAIAD